MTEGAVGRDDGWLGREWRATAITHHMAHLRTGLMLAAAALGASPRRAAKWQVVFRWPLARASRRVRLERLNPRPVLGPASAEARPDAQARCCRPARTGTARTSKARPARPRRPDRQL